MKKTSKIIVALAIIFTILAIGVMSYATTGDSAGTLLQELTGDSTVKQDNIKDLGNAIIAVVRIVGVVVAVVILLILGIKYMMGSAEEKADYKKSMIPYIVGAVLIFASTAIVGVIYDMASSLNTK